jgi:mannose-1-phosphate guanylyltransferase
MLHAVIMAGGGGTRLWPASRRRKPKQLLPLGADPNESLLAATCRRLEPVVGNDRVWVVTAAEQAAAVSADLPRLPKRNLLSEPCPRNTAAAIGLAAVHLLHRDPEAVLGALPADHAIGDEKGYGEVIARAFALAETEEAIVTVGIRPTAPETGFGYLEPGAPAAAGARVVARFVEKPVRAAAEDYVARGFLWNGGLFFARARRLLDEIAQHLPSLAEGLDVIARALASGDDAAAAEATARVYPGLPSISIDHGVMEKTRGILVVPGDFGWNDVGAWSALAETRSADAAGNVCAGEVVAVDAAGNIVATDAGLVALVGVSGLVVVRAGNAVLVVPRARAQDVREIVARLGQDGREEYL